MSRDADLIVTCACGCIEIIKKNGYHTHDLTDALTMGATASRLCRHRMRWLMRAGAVLFVAALAGVAGMAWVDGLNRAREEEAERWISEGENRLDRGDDLGAVDAFTSALAIRTDTRSLLFRGFAHYRLCDFKSALSDAEEALALDRGCTAALRCREMALGRLK